MLDARNSYRKVSRAINDFSPEQQKNIAAIVWLYRGQSERFIGLVREYLEQAIGDGQASAKLLSDFGEALGNLIDLAEPFATMERDRDPLAETWAELTSARAALSADVETFTIETAARAGDWGKNGNRAKRNNTELHATRKGLHDIAGRCQDLAKQLDLAARLAGKAVDIATKELMARKSDLWANSDINAAHRCLGDARTVGTEALRLTRYFVRQADWLHERFPEAELRDVEGLVRLVGRAEIEAHDWSLTPGRYVGIAPDEEDEDFDFEEAMRLIHTDLSELNEEAVNLAARIQHNFEGLRV